MPSRREFVSLVGTGSALVVLGGSFSFRVPSAWGLSTDEKTSTFIWLKKDEAKLVERLSSAIIPSVGSLGAAEIGTVYYIDRVLHADENTGAAVRVDLAKLAIAVTPEEENPLILERIRQDFPNLFATIRALTIDAYYNSPRVWLLIGYPGPPCRTDKLGYPGTGTDFEDLQGKEREL